jgi:hypothetical protein
MESIEAELEAASLLIVDGMKESFRNAIAKERTDLKRIMRQPASRGKEEQVSAVNYRIETFEFAIAEVVKRMQTRRVNACWRAVRQITIHFQNRSRNYQSDLKRIASWEQSEKRTKRLFEVTIRKGALEWVVGEVMRIKERHGYADLMKEKVRIDAAAAHYPEQELTDEEMQRRMANIRATWTPEDFKNKLVGGGTDEVEIRVCKVFL